MASGVDTTPPRMDTEAIISEFDDEERKLLIEAIVKQDRSLTRLARRGFLSLWFSEIGTLAKRHDPTSAEHKLRFVPLNNPCKYDIPSVITGWKPLPKLDSEEPIVGKRRKTKVGQGTREDMEGNGSYDVAKQGDVVRRKVLERDKERCAVTQHSRTGLHISHLFAFELHQEGELHKIWNYLADFWGEDLTNQLQAALLGGDNKFNTEQVHNMMALAPHLHSYRDTPLVAFRPVWINDTRTSLDSITFHWLPLSITKLRETSAIPTTTHPYPNPGFLDELRDSPGDNIVIFNNSTKLPIHSEMIFTMTTDDPIDKPLPSFELLHLQWHRALIAAMQGTGEEEDDDYDSGDDCNSVL